MKKLFILIFGLCLLPFHFCIAAGETTTTATLTFTNTVGTTNGETITLYLNSTNAITYTWTNLTSVGFKQLAATNTPQRSATNFFTKFTNDFANRLIITYGTATSVVIKPYGLNAMFSGSISTNWGTLAFVTNGLSNNLTLTVSNVSAIDATFTNSITTSNLNVTGAPKFSTGPPTIGYVWTATDTNGNGSWQTTGAASGTTGSGATVLSTSAVTTNMTLSGTPTQTNWSNATHAHTNNATGGQINENAFNFTDITTNDVSTNKHGLMPKGDNNANHFYNGKLQQSTIAASQLADGLTGSGLIAMGSYPNLLYPTITQSTNKDGFYLDVTGRSFFPIYVISNNVLQSYYYIYPNGTLDMNGGAIVTTSPTFLGTPSQTNWSNATHAHTNNATGGALGSAAIAGTITNNTSGSAATVTQSPLTNAVTNLPSLGTPGTYTKMTYDAQGRGTNGSNPTTFAGYGLSDSSANFFTILTDKNGNQWTNLNATNVVGNLTNNTTGSSATVTQSPLTNAIAGILTNSITGSAATVTQSPLTNAVTNLPSIGTAGTYRSTTFDAQGRETSGSNPTTFAGYGLSDSSANLAAALTDEAGTGTALFIGANGLVARTSSTATSARTITAGSAKISVSNGDGVSGNPAIDFGTVSSANLSDGTNIDLLNGTQTITGNKVFTGTISGIGATNVIQSVYLPGTNVTFTTNGNQTVSVASSGGGSSSIVITNTSFVTPSGNDSTAIRTRLDKPFATPSAAKTNSFPDDLITIYPGNWTNSESISDSLSTNILNYFLFPGARLYTVMVQNPDETTPVFTDAGLTNGITNIVRGDGEFYAQIDGNLGGNGDANLIILTNSASVMDIKCKRLGFLSLNGGDNNNELAPINISACKKFTLEADELVGQLETADAIQIGNGDCDISIKSLSTNWAGNFGINFMATGSTHYDQIFHFHDFRTGGHTLNWNTTNANDAGWVFGDIIGSSQGVAIWSAGAGKFYVSGNGAGKLYSGDTGAYDATISIYGATNYVSGFSKCSANWAGWITVTNGILDITIPTYEDTGISPNSAVGGTVNNSGGQLYVHGGLFTTKKNGINHSGGTSLIENIRFDTSASNNYPCKVSASGLTLKNCTLISSNGVASIYAASPVTITNLGNTYINNPLGANITVVGAPLIYTNCVVTKTANYTLTIVDDTVISDATGGSRTNTLPDPATVTQLSPPKNFTVKKADSSSNTVVIKSAAGNIDGAATVSTTTQYKSWTFFTDGSNWFIK